MNSSVKRNISALVEGSMRPNYGVPAMREHELLSIQLALYE